MLYIHVNCDLSEHSRYHVHGACPAATESEIVFPRRSEAGPSPGYRHSFQI